MRIKLTLRRPEGESANLAVTADATATVGDLARALAEGDPGRKGAAVPERLTLQVSDLASSASGEGRVLDPSSDLLSAGIRSGSTVSLTQLGLSFASPQEGRGPAAAVLRVLSGPDAGREFSLPAGTSRVGRDRDMDVRLSDPLVSKRHARVVVGSGVEITDTNSANGILVGGMRVSRATLTPADTVVLGDTTISVVSLQRVANLPASSPVIEFNRSPRVVPVFDERSIQAPEIPREKNRRRFPLVAMVAPLLMGVVLYTVTRNPLSLVFVALSPLIMAGTWLDSRINGKREYKDATDSFLKGIEATRTEIEAAHRLERAVRCAAHPAISDIVAAVGSLGPLLWFRRPEHDEFLTVRLGVGTTRSRCVLDVPSRSESRPEHWAQLSELAGIADGLSDSPVIGDFRSAGSIGIAGPEEPAAGVVRAVAAQLVASHSPAELTVAVVASASSRRRWEWMQWVPHTGSAHSPIAGDLLAAEATTAAALVSRLEEVVSQRRGSSEGGDAAPPVARGRVSETAAGPAEVPMVPSIVVVVENDAPVDRARLTRLAETGPDVNVHVLWFAPALADLPSACRSFVMVSGDGSASVGDVRTGRHSFPVAIETLSVTECEETARRLAPMVDAGAPVDDDAGLPQSISFLSLIGSELGDNPQVQVERWRESGSLREADPALWQGREGNLRAVIGQAVDEPMVIDLRSQGPHALVGGTTGSGKSEFLQAWLLGMAMENSPERVTFLLVDYKGGAAFAECKDLPHTVGLVTDLSPHMVRRALTSLRAELRFREHLLNRVKAKDLAELEKRGGSDAPPSLVIIVDEFAALKTEVPEFVDGVVDVAQRGRSLGLHLILATQRPAGVITDSLRANTNLRVALRMADEDNSTDVLGNGMAAHFDPSTPGRGAVRTGPGRITLFQSAYAGGRTAVGEAKPQIRIAELGFGVLHSWEIPSAESNATSEAKVPPDITRVVRTVVEAARAARVPEPRKPWLPVLAETYDLSLLSQRTDTDLAFGVMDDPGHQDQRTVYFHPESEGNLAIFGAGGTGKSGVLRTLAAAAAVTPRGGPVHVYGLDFGGGGLNALEVLPNVGAIISGDDTERTSRLLLWLRDLVDARKAEYAGATLSEFRSSANKQDEPRILVLLDGFGAFRQEYESSRSGLFTVFQQLLVDGRSVGVHVALSADRPGSVPSSVAAGAQRKIVLRQSDENSYLVLDVPRDVLSITSPAGRAIDAATGLEVQVAVLGGSPNIVEQKRALEGLAAAFPPGFRRPLEIKRLADLIPSSSLPREVSGLPVLGVADDTLTPMGFEPVGTLLVSGPPASGRTTAVHAIAASVHRLHPTARLVHVSGRTSPLANLPIWSRSERAVDAVAGLARELVPTLSEPPAPGQMGVMLVIESIADFLGSPAEGPLTEAIKQAKRNGHFVVAEADSAAWGSSWPLLVEVRAGRRGISLQPDQMEGDMLFRTSFPRVQRSEFPPGRGLMVQSGRVRKVQLPMPD